MTVRAPSRSFDTQRGSLPVLAVDGPAASGKTTVAALLAQELGLLHVSSGAVYRAVAQAASQQELSPRDTPSVCAAAERLSFGVERQELRVDGLPVHNFQDAAIDEYVSRIATSPELRHILTRQLRSLASGRSVVMDGRDIGVVVFPGARLKYYLDATLDERARRRAAQTRMGIKSVLSALADRDERDRQRRAAPLRAADDAVVLDTTDMTIEQVVAQIAGSWRARSSRTDS